jgi:hypothetical protein
MTGHSETTYPDRKQTIVRNGRLQTFKSGSEKLRMFVPLAWQTYRLGQQSERRRNRGGGGAGIFEILKTRNLLIFRDCEVWLDPPLVARLSDQVTTTAAASLRGRLPFAVHLSLLGISHRISCIVGTGDAFAAWANDRKQHCFPTDKCTGLQDYERPNRGMFVVLADCWGISRRAARSTCSQTAGQSEQLGFSASFPCTP